MAANSIQVTGTLPVLFEIDALVRVRPFNSKELPYVTSIKDQPLFIGDGSLTATPQQKFSTKGIRRIVQVVDERVLIFDPPEENPVAQYSRTIVAGGRKQKDMRYAFDHVFDESVTQEDVSPTLSQFNEGLYAYRQTTFGWRP
jgi:kinesin family member 18/19